MRLSLFLLLIFSAASARAERVLMVGNARRVVAVSVIAGFPWKVGEEACVVTEGRGKACGEIIKTQPTVAFLRLDRDSVVVQEGDTLQRPGRNRRLAAVNSSSQSRPNPKELLSEQVVNFSGGVNFGSGFFFTSLQLQVEMVRRLAWGFQALYSSSSFDSISANGIGGLLTLNFYHQGYFQGFWGQLGGGALSISASDGTLRQGKTVPIFTATLGYRLKLLPQLNLGGAVGAQWVGNPKVDLVEVNFTSFKPLFTVDIGWGF